MEENKLNPESDIKVSENDIAISESLNVNDHKVIEYNQKVVLASEGETQEEALQALKELALKHHANAILDVKIKCYRMRFLNKSRFVITGLAAIIDGPLFKSPNGYHVNIDEKLARPNSPNQVKTRYLGVMLTSLLIILGPTLVSFFMRHNLNPSLAYYVWGFFLVLAIILWLFYFPRKRVSYLLRGSKRQSI